jgi:hypothetical protein
MNRGDIKARGDKNAKCRKAYIDLKTPLQFFDTILEHVKDLYYGLFFTPVQNNRNKHQYIFSL